MLTWEDDVEVRALRRRGWSISAIARHTGFDRKTVRKYLAGDGKPRERARPGPDPFDEFVDYVTARLTEDSHLWARTLCDELEPLGFTLSYQSLTRNIRGLGGCPRVWRFDRMATVCDPGSGRVTASFAGVAKHYGVSAAICPPRRGNRKGVVEKANHIGVLPRQPLFGASGAGCGPRGGLPPRRGERRRYRDCRWGRHRPAPSCC